jgi:hypothetical protein
MVKHTGTQRAEGGTTSGGSVVPSARGETTKRSTRSVRLAISRDRQVEAVMAAARRSGLLDEKGSRIGARVSPALVKRAKARTGIKADTDLIEFALANIALEDKFAAAFWAVRGKVEPDLNLEF